MTNRKGETNLKNTLIILCQNSTCISACIKCAMVYKGRRYMYVYKGSDQSWAGFKISPVQDTARAVSSARQKKKKEKNSVWSIKVSWQMKSQNFQMLVLPVYHLPLKLSSFS